MLKWCQNNLSKKRGERKTLNFFTTCKFVITCHDKNVIYDSTIPKKKRLYDGVACYSTSY